MTQKQIIKTIGKKFGHLRIIDFAYIKQTNSYWKCSCDCGNEKIISLNKLKSGDTHSCGCLKVYKHRLGQTGFNKIYSIYKRRAKKENRSFDLNREEFKHITSQNCFYCGESPSMNSVSDTIIDKNKKEYTLYRYNGLDRIDANKGYEKNNIVPCCKWCNYAKRNKIVEEFKKHIIKMYNHLNQNSLPPDKYHKEK